MRGRLQCWVLLPSWFNVADAAAVWVRVGVLPSGTAVASRWSAWQSCRVRTCIDRVVRRRMITDCLLLTCSSRVRHTPCLSYLATTVYRRTLQRSIGIRRQSVQSATSALGAFAHRVLVATSAMQQGCRRRRAAARALLDTIVGCVGLFGVCFEIVILHFQSI